MIQETQSVNHIDFHTQSPDSSQLVNYSSS
jgi:hypothetical protein